MSALLNRPTGAPKIAGRSTVIYAITKPLIHGAMLALSLATQAAAVDLEAAGLAVNTTLNKEHSAGRFDGVVLVGGSDGKSYQAAFGFADRALQIPHRVDEVWRWASVSKQVAAVLTLQLVEQGQLSLSTPIGELLPEFKAPDALKISILDLLRHTSGLPNPDDSPTRAGKPDAMPSFYLASIQDGKDATAQALSYCAGPPKHAVGTRFEYNNCDTLVLQAILEKRTRLPYGTLLQQSLIDPVGLASVRFVARDADVTTGSPKGYMADGTAEPDFHLASFGAAAAMAGNAQDLWRFDHALMQGKLLSPTSLQALWQGVPALGYVALGAWSFPAKLAGCREPVQLVERHGEIGGVQVRNLMAPSLKTALIVFSNNGATDFGQIWQGKGLSYELASQVFCPQP